MDADRSVGDVDTRLQAMEAKLAAALNRIDELERQPVAPAAPPIARAVVPSAPVVDGPPSTFDRRRAIRTGVVAAGAAAAGMVLGNAEPAAATNGDFLKVGTHNEASFFTRLTVRGAANQVGLQITDDDNDGSPAYYSALWLQAGKSQFTNGLEVSSYAKRGAVIRMYELDQDGVALDLQYTNGVGIKAVGETGYTGQFWSTSGTGLYVQSNTGNGAIIYGYNYQLLLSAIAGRPAPTTDATTHYAGEFIRDSANDMWFCIGTGTPGKFVKLAGPATAGSMHVLPAPARIYDSRPGTQPTAIGPKTQLTGNVARVLDVTANSSGVPVGAKAAVITVLLVNAAQANGNFTLWSNGVTRPSGNTMVWGAGSGRYTTLALTAVDATGKIQVAASNPTDIVLDVVGYYR